MAEVTNRSVSETSADNDRAGGGGDTAFAVPPDDPRRTENRGGLAATVETMSSNLAGTDGNSGPEGPANLGTTDADVHQTGHDVGAAGTGAANGGQVGLSTVGMSDPDTGPAGAGPVDGSRSGAVAPRVEVSDVGLVDLNAADLSAPSESGDNASVPADTQV